MMLLYEMNLTIRFRDTEPLCRVSGSKVISFESYCMNINTAHTSVGVIGTGTGI